VHRSVTLALMASTDTWATILWRGMRRRCGRCGAGGIFQSWFRLRSRCPRCGYRFEREEGFATGVWLLNFSVTEGFMLVGLIGFIVVRGVAHMSVPLWPVLLVTVAAAVIAPVLCYPFATSTWAALDLAMRPLEPVEEAEALLAAQDGPPDTSDASEPPEPPDTAQDA